jgi:hypothetical protein
LAAAAGSATAHVAGNDGLLLQVRGAVTRDDPLRVEAHGARLQGEQDDVQALLISGPHSSRSERRARFLSR